VLEEVGRGGMGIVYKARQLGLDRLVALKLIPAMPGGDPDATARFRSEGEAIARLRHPHIIQVHEVGACPAGHYLVMEFAEGGSLASRLRGAPLSARTAALLVGKVARAVHAAHEKGVVHRDIKPGNIQLLEGLDAPLEKCTPKISDFGVARRLDETSSLTLPGEVLGTPGYMAPEQAQGKKDIGPLADVYALGVVLYECLTGRVPFHGASPVETFHLLMWREPIPPSRLRPGLPRDLETVCLRCLNKEPHKRYPSAADLADDLERFLDHQPVRARPTPSWERLAKWVKRQPGTAGLAGCVAALVVVGFVLVSWLWRRAEAERANSSNDRDRALLLADAHARASREAKRLSVRLLLEHGVSLCEGGDHGPGLLWLARGLEELPEGEAALEGSIRRLLGGWRMQVHPLLYHRRHPHQVRCAAYAPDGRTLAVASRNKVYFYESSTGKLLRPPLTLPGAPLKLCSHGKGGLAAILHSGLVVQLHELPGGAARGPPVPGDFLSQADLSPDGKVLLLVRGRKVRPYLVKTGRPLTASWVHGETVSAAAFSRDGRWVVTGASDKLVRVWHVQSGKLVRVLRGHDAPVISAAFSRDGRLVLTGGDDQRACMWDWPQGVLRSRLRHQHSVSAVAFDPKGRWLAAGCDDNTVQLWQAAREGTPPGRLGAPLRHADSVTCLAVSPDGGSLATGSEDTTLRVWRVRPPGPEEVLPHPDPVFSLARSPDEKWMLTSTSRGEVRLWDLASGTRRVIGEHQSVLAAAFRPDSKEFVVGYYTGHARRYETSGAPVGPVMRHGAAVLCIAYSPDGRYIATGCEDGDKVVRLYDARTARVVRRMVGHTRKVFSLAFTPDGRRLLTGSWDHTVRLWDVATGEEVGQQMRHRDLVQSVTVSPDGRTALSGGDDYTARLWDLSSGSPRGTPLRHPDKVQVTAFGPCGGLLATGTKGRRARLWDVDSGKQVGPPLAHGHEVRSLLFSPDGKFLFSSGWDGAVRRWLAPAPWQGPAERIRTRLEVDTGSTLDDNGGVVVLDLPAWEERVRRLPSRR
jgi:WD40 repeat protein